MSAVDALRACVTEDGFVASTEARTNYRRVWGRDAMVCGLAALVSGEADLLQATRASLETLARHQGPVGQIPSNVSSEGTVSYGGTAGRVDATIWWVLGACLYGRLVDDAWLAEQHEALVDCERVLRAWEHNDAGLIYVPQSGDWADEYALSGFLLYDQALRLWASRELHAACRRQDWRIPLRRGPTFLAERIGNAFATDDGFLAGFHAGVRETVFDAFGTALCTWLEVGPAQARERAFLRADALTKHGLVPAFDPPIEEDDPRYASLEHAAAEHLRNRPGRYHNGGLWPLVTGFWAMAARRRGAALARMRWAEGIAAANRAHGYPEYLDAVDGAPGGTTGQAWSAAAEILATADLEPLAP